MKLLRAWLPSSEIILERNEYFFIILPSQPNHTLIILTKRKYTSKLKNTSYFGVLSLILLLFFFFLFPSVLIFVPFIILKSLQKKNTNLKIRYSNRNQPDVLCRPVYSLWPRLKQYLQFSPNILHSSTLVSTLSTSMQ